MNKYVESLSRPTLSACMIVKNEEKFLAQCLESIKGAVDEIIIVDTGSTDRTVEIARQYTDKVYFHAWNNDFSEARNVSLGYATCDWILQIDADEELEREDIPLLYQSIQSDMYDVVFVTILNQLSGGQWGKHRFQRLFRRGKAYYEGIVHNQLVYEGDSAVAAIRLYHYGYNLTPEQMQAKYERTGNLLRRQIAGDPLNTFARQNLVHALRAVQDYEGMIAEGKAALESGSPHTTPTHRQQIKTDMSYAMMQLGRYAEAETLAKEVLDQVPYFLDAIFNLATIYMLWGKIEEAIRYYKRFLEVKRDEERHPRFSQLIVDVYDFESRVYLNLGVCYGRLGDTQKAIQSYRQAVAYDKHLLNPYVALSQILFRQGDLTGATKILAQAQDAGITEEPLYLFLGDLYQRQGRRNKAETAFRQAIAAGESPEAYNGLAMTLLNQNRLDEAHVIVKQGLAKAEDHVGLWLTAAHIAHREQRPDDVRQAARFVLKCGAPGQTLFPELAHLCIGVGAYDAAILVIEQFLETNEPTADALSDLATCYVKQGRWYAALAGYRAALALNPHCGPAIANIRQMQQDQSHL